MSEESCNLNLNLGELQQMLQKCIAEKLVVKSFTSKLANEKGENYGSLLYTLEVFVQYINSDKSDLFHIIAKTAPPSEYLMVMFNFPTTFCKEMNFYKLANAAYENLEKENGLQPVEMSDVCPSFYGARTSLSGDSEEEAQPSAVLLMSNLAAMYFKMRDRLEGLDLKHTEMTISKLAEFHALPIALRLKQFKIYEDAVMRAACFKPNPKFDSEAQTQFRNDFLQGLESKNQHLQHYLEKIKQRIIDSDLNYDPVSKEPFATVVHNDLWTNNILFSYRNKNEKDPIKVKFIDFQGTIICSPVKDIIFLLFSSAQDYVIDHHYDHLIDLYYECFINKLRQLHCDTHQFSKEKFYEEISMFAPNQFYHIAFMYTVIYAERSEVKELKDVTSFESIMVSWNTQSKHKLERLVKFFDKKGWL